MEKTDTSPKKERSPLWCDEIIDFDEYIWTEWNKIQSFFPVPEKTPNFCLRSTPSFQRKKGTNPRKCVVRSETTHKVRRRKFRLNKNNFVCDNCECMVCKLFCGLIFAYRENCIS